MNRAPLWTVALVAAFGVGISACDGRGEQTPGDVQRDLPIDEPIGGVPGMDAMMQRHAQDADAMASAMRKQIRQMRELPPEQWHDHMSEHVTQVSQMLSLMTRTMRKLDADTGLSDEEIGRMLGMSGEEHRRMLEAMRTLRTDLDELQTASRDELRERMPNHLDALERMTRMMDESAAAMRDR